MQFHDYFLTLKLYNWRNIMWNGFQDLFIFLNTVILNIYDKQQFQCFWYFIRTPWFFKLSESARVYPFFDIITGGKIRAQKRAKEFVVA